MESETFDCLILLTFTRDSVVLNLLGYCPKSNEVNGSIYVDLEGFGDQVLGARRKESPSC